jgi:hypothetical protein
VAAQARDAFNPSEDLPGVGLDDRPHRLYDYWHVILPFPKIPPKERFPNVSCRVRHGRYLVDSTVELAEGLEPPTF